MIQQCREGHSVAMLWPGQIGFVNKKTSVKKHKNVEFEGHEIQSFEIINPLPVSFDEGITDISAFIADAGRNAYEKLIEEFLPDVIHVHTLMGIHKAFLQVAREKKIKLVFTAHDFFPVCPKVTMFRQGTVCNNVRTCEECGVCNATALSIRKIWILQSPIYRKLKDSALVKKFRKKHRDQYLSGVMDDDFVESVGTADDYKRLRNYYYSLLLMMDKILYNSSVTKAVYESVFNLPKNCIVSITHSDIRDNRKIKEFSRDKLHIRYLGPNAEGKGFFVLKNALDKLWNKQQNFCLDIHFTPIQTAPYIKVHERYAYADLEKIFNETDVLIAPSIWYETFGFTVLEALSYGVPVVISGNVGAKDILANGAGIIINDINSENLYEALGSLTQKNLKEMNKIITENQQILQIEEMSNTIEKICYDWKF